ncbi:MAG: hypothetical protein AAF590_03515 [Pseudomonadota bacterium]
MTSLSKRLTDRLARLSRLFACANDFSEEVRQKSLAEGNLDGLTASASVRW